ncbi:MAG: spore coat protein CotJB [Candidatus Fimivivens sp.]
MIYENANLFDNTLPLDHIIPSQNARIMQRGQQDHMMPARNMKTMSDTQGNRPCVNNQSQVKLQLAQCCFAVHEAVLYLDTHPNDQNALAYYRKKQQQLERASENYKKVVGPICACMVDTNTGNWQWIETPWPWEIEED